MNIIILSVVGICILHSVWSRNLNGDIFGDDLDTDENFQPVGTRGGTSGDLFEFMSGVIRRLDDLDEKIKDLSDGNKVEVCPDGWYKYGKSCYLFSDKDANWFEALLQNKTNQKSDWAAIWVTKPPETIDKRTQLNITSQRTATEVPPWNGQKKIFCRSLKGYLAEIDSYSENSYLKGRAKSLGGSYWLGGTDLTKENHWMWVTSDRKITTSMFSDWYRTEPSNNRGEEHCLDIYKKYNAWNDRNCHEYIRFICERDLK